MPAFSKSSAHRERAARLLMAAVVLALALASSLAMTTVAMARQGVYGGSTKAADPIVITSDAKAKKLTGAVLRIRIDGKDDWWTFGARAKVRPAPRNPDMLPVGVLGTSRNGRGRFAARTFLQAQGDPMMVAEVRFAGTLKPRKASGTIKARVFDSGTGKLAGQRTLKWTAVRAAGRVYGGATSADLPIVITLDRRGVNVAELGLSCYTERSTPPGSYWSANEWLADFPLVNRSFADTFNYPEQESDGTTTTYQWNVAGRVGATSARGTVALTVSGTESGSPWSFEMPTTRFTAATG